MGKRALRKALQRQTHGSVLVDSVSKLEALASLLERPADSLRLNTLFRTDHTGWKSPAAFHQACDGKGPSFTLIKASDGSAFGGYTSISWNSSNTYYADAHACLFRTDSFSQTQSSISLEKISRSGSGDEICGYASYGPTFGGGQDLFTFSSGGIQMFSDQSSYSIRGSLFNATLPKSASNFQMEVLQVSTMPANFTQELQDPWVSNCIWSTEVYINIAANA